MNSNLCPISFSKCTMHEGDTRDAFTCATRDMHNPFAVEQMSYINFTLSEEAALRQEDREKKVEGGGEGARVGGRGCEENK